MKLPAAYLGIGLATTAIWALLFFSSGLIMAELPNPQNWTTDWDRAIPFFPPAVWFYQLAYLFPAATLLLIREPRQADQLLLSIILATAVAAVVYLMIPMSFPYPIPPDTFSGRWLAWNLRLDFAEPANKFPSLHVAMTWLFARALHGQGVSRTGLGLGWAVCAAIIVSTLLVRQHILADVAGGLVLGVFVWPLAGGLIQRWLMPDAGGPWRRFGILVQNSVWLMIYFVGFCLLLPSALFALASMLDARWPLTSRVPDGVGWALLGLGGVICAGSFWQLWNHGRGLPVSHLPPTRLVSRGLYGLWRHPIYVGFTALFAGVSILRSSAWSLFVGVPLLVLLWLGYAKWIEEPGLRCRFGSAWDKRAVRTRRLIPVFRRPRTGPLRERLMAQPRIELGNWPTPIEQIEFRGRTVWVKRDDLSGFGRGGAKTRKIEGLLGHLKARGKKWLITVAGNITNLAYDLIPATEAEGIELDLLIQNDPPLARDVREKLFRAVRSQISLAGKSIVWTFLRCVILRLHRGNSFLLLPGGSHPSAIIGNAVGFLEMVDQFRAQNRKPPRRIYVSLATGTTLAGYLLAAAALKEDGEEMEVIGVQVYPGRAVWRTRCMLAWTEWYLGIPRIDRKRIHCVNRELHNGFGKFPAELAELSEELEAETGLKTDPVFGTKTWRVLMEDAGVEEVLFWHCGYTPEWKSFAPQITSI